tara:strand:+ start:927 stop:1286 length:360 start_codon:yes stop_codon:yes gene_type:complete
LQDNLNDEKIVLNHLTSHDERQENLKSLQDSFRGIGDMITEQDTFRTRQAILLKEYTRMIDIGTTKIPRFDQSPQTDLSFLENRPDNANAIMDVKSTQELIHRTFDPIETLSFKVEPFT